MAHSPVRALNISGTTVDDLSPLIQSKVEALVFDRYNLVRDNQVLALATTLKSLNGKPYPPPK